jgi:hypothetical protein
MPIFIAILTTIRCHPSLAQNDLAKPSSGISRGNGRWCHHDAHQASLEKLVAARKALNDQFDAALIQLTSNMPTNH